jgi:hypothetical protein
MIVDIQWVSVLTVKAVIEKLIVIADGWEKWRMEIVEEKGMVWHDGFVDLSIYSKLQHVLFEKCINHHVDCIQSCFAVLHAHPLPTSLTRMMNRHFMRH